VMMSLKPIVTTVRKSMNAKAMSVFDRAMLSKKYIIETINDQLKTFHRLSIVVTEVRQVLC
jgi:hypothetical protein